LSGEEREIGIKELRSTAGTEMQPEQVDDLMLRWNAA
jgi:hypothetical protein